MSAVSGFCEQMSSCKGEKSITIVPLWIIKAGIQFPVYFSKKRTQFANVFTMIKAILVFKNLNLSQI